MDQNFRNGLIGTLAGATTVGVISYFLLKATLQPMLPMTPTDSEDERPPVVVTSGGSVDVFADPLSGSMTGPGTFLVDPLTGLVYHVHSGAAPLAFYVTISNYTACDNGGKPPFTVNDMTFTYAKNNQTQSFRLFKGDLNGLTFLTIDLNSEPAEWDAMKKHTFKLKHNDNWKLRSVTFPNISTCMLREDFTSDSQRPVVRVKQLR